MSNKDSGEAENGSGTGMVERTRQQRSRWPLSTDGLNPPMPAKT